MYDNYTPIVVSFIPIVVLFVTIVVTKIPIAIAFFLVLIVELFRINSRKFWN